MLLKKVKLVFKFLKSQQHSKDVFNGLDVENKKYDLNSFLKVGSMTEASLNGNWGVIIKP